MRVKDGVGKGGQIAVVEEKGWKEIGRLFGTLKALLEKNYEACRLFLLRGEGGRGVGLLLAVLVASFDCLYH